MIKDDQGWDGLNKKLVVLAAEETYDVCMKCKPVAWQWYVETFLPSTELQVEKML
jgi:hypothetical protein